MTMPNNQPLRPGDRAKPSAPVVDVPRRPLLLRRAFLFFHRMRLRVARGMLLPQLSPDQAFDLREQVRHDGELTRGYALMCALAAGIAILGLLQSSTAVVIGAMLVSPLMSPIAAMGFGFASLDGRRIRDAARVVLVGAAIGISTGVLLTWLSPIRNATPEILARTEPNLLDLAIALFSGIAGGYATVIGKGGTAIGVAIATALMPPLTVVGYGIGVLEPLFAMGALLLFLTNLAAITFAFALVARLSGVARPLRRVEWTPRYIAVLIATFLALATPLSMTLLKLTKETRIRNAARAAIIDACGGAPARIAQLDVKSGLFSDPSVDALVIARSYTTDADEAAQARIERMLGTVVKVNIQQVLATDIEAQTRAMVDAAMERTTAGIAADVPPIQTIRESMGLPTQSLWSDRAQRIVYVEPVAVPGWSFADYRQTEQTATRAAQGWTVRIVPPPRPTLTIAAAPAIAGAEAPDTAPLPAEAVALDDAIWAIQRWGMGAVSLSGGSADFAQTVRTALGRAGIKVREGLSTPESGSPAQGSVNLGIYAPSPSQEAARQPIAAAAPPR